MREDLEQKLARLTGLAERKQRQADELKEQLAGLRVTRKSGDGLLTATVTANGQLVDLRIDDRALRNGRELSANLLNLVFQASAAAAQQVQALAAPLLEDSSIDPAELGLGPTPPAIPGAPGGHQPPPPPPLPQDGPPQTFRQSLRDQPPQQTPPPPPPTRRPPVDDDPEEGGSIFRKDTW